MNLQFCLSWLVTGKSVSEALMFFCFGIKNNVCSQHVLKLYFGGNLECIPLENELEEIHLMGPQVEGVIFNFSAISIALSLSAATSFGSSSSYK